MTHGTIIRINQPLGLLVRLDAKYGEQHLTLHGPLIGTSPRTQKSIPSCKTFELRTLGVIDRETTILVTPLKVAKRLGVGLHGPTVSTDDTKNA